jgi:hypothetical protein
MASETYSKDNKPEDGQQQWFPKWKIFNILNLLCGLFPEAEVIH